MVPGLPATALALALGAAWSMAGAEGIYTCVDAKGRRLTSDRPIAECLDREQKELGSSGTVRRTLPPQFTATERAAQEERERKEAEERLRQAEEKRMQRALLTRYPNRSTHDMERTKALQAVQDVIASSERRIVDLKVQRKQLDTEAEFYKSRAQWPLKLRRQVEDNEQQLAAQQRFIANQADEKQRLDKRFDEELVKLKVLWAQGATASVGGASAPR